MSQRIAKWSKQSAARQVSLLKKTVIFALLIFCKQTKNAVGISLRADSVRVVLRRFFKIVEWRGDDLAESALKPPAPKPPVPTTAAEAAFNDQIPW
jgi:hypothetical protein